MNSCPRPTSATQPRSSSDTLTPSSSSSGPSSERQGARPAAWLWLSFFLRNRGIAQLTEGVEGPDHLLPTVDGRTPDVHHGVDGGLGGIRHGLDHMVVDGVDSVLAPIVRPAGDLGAVLAAQVAGAERDAGAGEAADDRRGDTDRSAARGDRRARAPGARHAAGGLGEALGDAVARDVVVERERGAGDAEALADL